MPNGKASNEGAGVRSPVIIAGAGPVGLSLALSLGHSGVDSIILEKNSGLEQYSRAILIPPRTLDIFEGWGLLELARQAGIFSPCLSVYDAESNKVAFSIGFSDLKDISENAGFLFLPQDRTQALLLATVQSLGKCEVRFGATVKAFSQAEDGVTVEGIDRSGGFSLYGQYLVGCDGGHSIIRQQLGLQLEGKTYKARVLIADVTLPTGTAIPTPRMALKANGPLVMLRFDDSRWRIVGTVDSGEADDQARSKNGVAARMRMLAGNPAIRSLVVEHLPDS
jgi:3-(3-hydroxy-phenyl)propionate hydroxylase